MSDESTSVVLLDRRTRAAWRQLRSQLADHLAGMAPGERVVLGHGEEDAVGPSPCVRLAVLHDEPRIRAEVVAARGSDCCQETDVPPWVLDREQRRADEVADLVVRTLRDVHGCLHPAFLAVEGAFVPTGIAAPAVPADPSLDTDTDTRTDGEWTVERIAREDRIEHPRDHDELVALVAAALGDLYGEAPEPDSDGDFPIRFGRSALFVRVRESEPTVELYAELVVDVADTGAARREANAFNRDAAFGTCWERGGVVRFRYALCAMPFSSAQLRLVLGRIASDLDERAGEMAERIGGQRFLDDVLTETAEEESSERSEPDEEPREEADFEMPGEPAAPVHSMVPVLRELLEVGEPSDRVVAGLFDGDVQEIAATIEALREHPPDGLDLAAATAALQQALWCSARRRADRVLGARRVALRGRPSSRQSALIAPHEVDDGGLDLDLDRDLDRDLDG